VRGLRLKSGTRNKYGAVRTKVDGIKFDSKAEARRYGELKLLERGGYIRELKIHPSYPIHYPRYRLEQIPEDCFICTVELDFSYFDNKDGQYHHEDVKGRDNRLSMLKRKLVEVRYNIKVEIIK